MRISWYLWMFSKVFKISTVLWTLFKKNHEFQKDNRENISIFLSRSCFTPNLSQENEHLSSQKHVLVIVERCNEAITSATPSLRNFTTWHHPPPPPKNHNPLRQTRRRERERKTNTISKKLRCPFRGKLSFLIFYEWAEVEAEKTLIFSLMLRLVGLTFQLACLIVLQAKSFLCDSRASAS